MDAGLHAGFSHPVYNLSSVGAFRQNDWEDMMGRRPGSGERYCDRQSVVREELTIHAGKTASPLVPIAKTAPDPARRVTALVRAEHFATASAQETWGTSSDSMSTKTGEAPT